MIIFIIQKSAITKLKHDYLVLRTSKPVNYLCCVVIQPVTWSVSSRGRAIRLNKHLPSPPQLNHAFSQVYPNHNCLHNITPGQWASRNDCNTHPTLRASPTPHTLFTPLTPLNPLCTPTFLINAQIWTNSGPPFLTNLSYHHDVTWDFFLWKLLMCPRNLIPWCVQESYCWEQHSPEDALNFSHNGLKINFSWNCFNNIIMTNLVLTCHPHATLLICISLEDCYDNFGLERVKTRPQQTRDIDLMLVQ